jgi:hypothetical protein
MENKHSERPIFRLDGARNLIHALESCLASRDTACLARGSRLRAVADPYGPLPQVIRAGAPGDRT